jgi:Zn-finger nucleic acid-binding protein
MFVGSRFCPRCGAESKRVGFDDDATLPCPRCKEPLQPLALGAIHVRECEACGGIWIDPEALQRICDQREEHAAVTSALAARVPSRPAPTDAVHYVPCPCCTKIMNRVNFSKSSGVIVDVCKKHGVWLDRGELQRVVGFVDAGGLTIARERERERLMEEQRHLAAMEAAHSVPALSPSTNGSTASWNTGASPSTSIEQFFLDALGMFVK